MSDNGSTDGSIEFIHQNYPRVRVLENGENLGFAKGNNAGIAQSSGQYVLILNPDTIIHDNALEKLVAFADSSPRSWSVRMPGLKSRWFVSRSSTAFPYHMAGLDRGTVFAASGLSVRSLHLRYLHRMERR